MTGPLPLLLDHPRNEDADDAPRSGIRHAAPAAGAGDAAGAPAPRPARAAPTRSFPDTPWTCVERAGQGDRAELGELCFRYREPLLGVALQLERSRPRAEDLVQGFLERFVAKNVASGLDRHRGVPLRATLRRCLRNHFYNVLDHERGEAQGGRFDHVDADDVALAGGLTAERAYRRACARVVLDGALARLRREETDAGRAARFEALLPRLRGDDDAAPLRDTAALLMKTEGAVKVDLHRLRLRHVAVLRAEVALTVERPEDVDAELHDLLSAWDDEEA